MARELSIDSIRSLHSWLVVLSYLYLFLSSSFSWIWSRRLSNLVFQHKSKHTRICHHLLAGPPLVKGDPLMFLPQTSLDTDPNKAKVLRLWLTTPSSSVEFALNFCCALASSNSDETSSKASFRSLESMRVLGFWAFHTKYHVCFR